jgi:hypothetical protein
MEFKYHVIARIDYEKKEILRRNKEMEFIWYYIFINLGEDLKIWEIKVNYSLIYYSKNIIQL